MTSILPPFSNIVAPGVWQTPNAPVLTVDWTNSLTIGLLGCWLPGAMGGIDLTGGLIGQMPFLGGGGGTGINPDGPSTDSSATVGGYSTNLPAGSPFLSTTGLTCFWRGMSKGNGSAFFMQNGILYGNGSVSPFWSFGFGDGNGTNNSVCFQYNHSGAASNNQIYATEPFNVMWDICAAADVTGAGNYFIYRDGSQIFSHSFESPINYNPPCFFAFDNQMNARASIVCWWNRQLRADEVMEMHLAPYQFIIPAEYDAETLMPIIPPVFILMPQIVT
jgi:hypothetical protein